MAAGAVSLRRVNVIARVGSTVTVGVPDEHGGQATLELAPPYVSPLFTAEPGSTALLLMQGPVPSLLPGNVIIAGDPAGNHVELTASGMSVYVFDPVGLTLSEAIRLGTAGDDFFAIADSNGASVAAISSSGGANFSAVTSGAWPVIGTPDWTGAGGPLDQVLDRRPRGLVAHTNTTSASAGTTTAAGFFEFGALLNPGRSYRLTGGFRVKSTAAGDAAELQVRYTTAPASGTPATPSLTSPVLFRRSSEVNTVARQIQLGGIFDLDSMGLPASQFRFLLAFSRLSGTGSVTVDPTATEPGRLIVEDVGPARTPTGTNVNDGSGGTATPPPTLRTLTVDATWMNAYNGAGAYLDRIKNAWFGQIPLQGMRKSMIGFPALTQLAGATVASVTLRLYVKDWSSPAGGTAVVGFHSYLAPPSGSLTALTGYTADVNRTGAWPGLGFGYITLTGHAAQEWVTGAKRGIYLGLAQGVSDPSYDISGQCAGSDPDTTIRPQLTITYTV